MSVKIAEAAPSVYMCVWDMAEGQLGIITAWGCMGHEGTVVQRWGSSIIAIGKTFIQSWPNLMAGPRNERCRVRLLTTGETIVVIDN